MMNSEDREAARAAREQARAAHMAAYKALQCREDMIILKANLIVAMAELDCCRYALATAKESGDVDVTAQCADAEEDAQEKRDQAEEAIKTLETEDSYRRRVEGAGNSPVRPAQPISATNTTAPTR